MDIALHIHMHRIPTCTYHLRVHLLRSISRAVAAAVGLQLCLRRLQVYRRTLLGLSVFNGGFHCCLPWAPAEAGALAQLR
jgi:hypothetical protein